MTEKHKKTLVEKHALDRLDKVEKKQQKAYEKRRASFSLNKLIMLLIFFIILGIMLLNLV